MTTPTHETLEQLATILSGRLDEDFLRALSEDAWLGIVAIANRDRHRLVPALYRTLCGEPFGAALPDEVRSYLALIADLNEERNAALRGELAEVVAALNAAGIEPILLKGAAALMDERRAVAGRMIGDLDLLLPDGHEADALAALRRIGFAPLPGEIVHHTVADLARPGNRASVDLHRALFDPPHERILLASEAIGRAERVDGDLRFRLLSFQDHVLHSVLHAQVHNGGYYGRHLCLGASRELAAWWDGIDWRAIEAWADAHRMRVVLEVTLLATRQFFGVPWPLARSPTRTAVRHHRRACEVEINGAWDIGKGRIARFREAIAPDRLSVNFGPDGWYIANVARLCGRAKRRHGLRGIYRRLIMA